MEGEQVSCREGVNEEGVPLPAKDLTMALGKADGDAISGA